MLSQMESMTFHRLSSCWGADITLSKVIRSPFFFCFLKKSIYAKDTNKSDC